MHNSINHILSRAMNNFAILLWIIKAVNLIVKHVTVLTNHLMLQLNRKQCSVFRSGENGTDKHLQV